MDSVNIFRSIDTPIRTKTSYKERWGTDELSLITAWESGRINKNGIYTHLIKYIKDGALPKLSFKGGHRMPFDDNEDERENVKYLYRYGTFLYLAQVQGLLGEDLDIDTSTDVIKTCSITKTKTIFTRNDENFKNAQTFTSMKKLEEIQYALHDQWSSR